MLWDSYVHARATPFENEGILLLKILQICISHSHELYHSLCRLHIIVISLTDKYANFTCSQFEIESCSTTNCENNIKRVIPRRTKIVLLSS